jgi:hypothetical protein
MDDKKKEILEALEQHNGIVSTACHNIGLARSTYYLWLKDDEEFKKAVDEIQEVAIDYVESKLFEKIEGIKVKAKNQTGAGESNEPVVYDVPPSDTAIIFYLKTKGKKRGYVERQEIDHSGRIGLTLIEGEPDERDEPIAD